MEIEIIFLLVSAIITIGFFSNYFFRLTRIPDLLYLVLFGYVVSHVFHIINPEIIWKFSPIFSAAALLIILFDTGSRMDIYKLIEKSTNIVFITLGNFVLALLTTFFLSHFIFGFDMLISFVLGSITAGTSSTIAIPLSDLVRNEIRREIRTMVKLESILTDPLVIIVSLVLIEASLLSNIATFEIIKGVIHMLSTSFVIGFLAGIVWGGVWHRFERYEYHYMLTVAFLFFLYVFAEIFGANGAITCFTVGLVLGNIRKIRKMLRVKHALTGISTEIMKFNSYITFFVRTFFFFSIGVILEFGDIACVAFGVVITLFLFASRCFIITVYSLLEKLPKRERIFMSLVAPRGLAAAVLAALLYQKYVLPHSEIIVQIIFTVIITSVIISTAGIAMVENKKKASSREG